MDYEKKYKEALKMAKGIIRYYKEHNRSDEAAIEDLEGIFPELKESEDEKVRKELLELAKRWKEKAKGFCPEVPLWPSNEEDCDRYIAWLEKQGEQKPQRMISAEAKEAMYDKPAWSEEDEEMFDAIIADIQFTQKAHTHDDNQAVYEREIDWLKSLKQRIGG